MEYPHGRYILYLLSRKMNAMEVRADCAAKGLLAPGDIEIRQILAQLGEIPTCWKSTVTPQNIRFRRWLRDKGLLKLWVRDDVTDKAVALLYKKAIRKDFETIITVHGDIGQAYRELTIKYPEDMVPTEVVLDRYQEFFWNIGEMSPEEIYRYLEVIGDEGEDLLPALAGDLAKTYGALGLQQRIKGEVFLQNCIEAANRQALRMNSSDKHGGSSLAGMSAAMRVGLEALHMLRDDMIEDEGDVGMRREAADFVARVVQADAVLSIDELNRPEIIDAEFVEAAEAGAGNVLTLTKRRSD